MTSTDEVPNLNENGVGLSTHLMYGYVVSVHKLLVALYKTVAADTRRSILRKILGDRFPEELVSMIQAELASTAPQPKVWLFSFRGIDIFNTADDGAPKWNYLRTKIRQKVAELEEEGIRMLTLNDLADLHDSALSPSWRARHYEFQYFVFVTTMLHSKSNVLRTSLNGPCQEFEVVREPLEPVHPLHRVILHHDPSRTIYLRYMSVNQLTSLKLLRDQVGERKLHDAVKNWKKGGKHPPAAVLGLGELFASWHDEVNYWSFYSWRAHPHMGLNDITPSLMALTEIKHRAGVLPPGARDLGIRKVMHNHQFGGDIAKVFGH